MTMFKLPIEPTADVLWTQDVETGEIVRWTRGVSRDDEQVWQGEGQDVTWSGLLERGPVFDRHPDLAGLPRTPWRRAMDGQIVDDNGYEVRAGSFDLVIRAVNEYAARLEAGPTAEDRTVFEDEIERVWSEAAAEKATDTAVRELVHFWRGVTSRGRDAAGANLGGLVDALDALVRARSSAGE